MFIDSQIESQKLKGSIEIICGSMFSGKTEELFRRLRRAQFANQAILLVKPSIDERYASEEVVSHVGQSWAALRCQQAQEILALWKGEQIVAIDEAQFFDQQIVAVCNELANKGARVIIAGLDMDFKGNPFGPMPALMATAEYVTKVHAVCTRTGNLANYSFRKSENDKLVMLGETEEYEPLSRAAYYKALRENSEK